MYQINVTVIETIGAYVCSGAISESDQFGHTQQIAVIKPVYLEGDDLLMRDPVGNLISALSRFASLMAESPK